MLTELDASFSSSESLRPSPWGRKYCNSHNILWFDSSDTKFCYQQLRESHVFLCLVQLVHPSSNGLMMRKYLPIHAVCSLWILVIARFKTAIHTRCQRHKTHEPVDSLVQLCKVHVLVHLISYLFWLRTKSLPFGHLRHVTFTCIHNQRNKFTWFPLASTVYM